MAEEKIILAEIDIDVEASIKETIRLKDEISKLSAETKEMKGTEKELTVEYVKKNATLKSLQTELKSNEHITQKIIQSNNAEKGSIEQLRAQLSVVSKEWSSLSKSERENTDRGKELSKQKLDLTETLKKEEKATGDTRRNVGNYTEMINEAKSAVFGFIPGLGNASKAAKIFGITLNLSLLPITAIIAAIVALVAYFKRTEEGSDKLKKAMAILGAIFNQIMEVVSKLGEKIVWAFENPKKAIADLWESIKTNVINRLKGLIDSWVAVGKIIKSVFTMDWEGVKKGAKEFGESMVQTVTGIDDAFNKAKNAIGEFMDEAMKEAKLAAELADRKSALRKKERAEILNDARDEKEIAELRAKSAQKDIYNGEERLKMLNKAIAIENAMMEDDLRIAKEKASIHKQEMSMSGESTEALDEQARLEAEIFNIQKNNAEARRGFERQRQSAINDMNEDQRKAAELAVENLNYELEVWKLNNKEKISSLKTIEPELIESERQRLETQNQLNKDMLDKQLDNNLISINDYNLAVLQQEDEKNKTISDLYKQFKEQEDAERLQAAQINYDNELALAQDNIFAVLDLQRQKNDLMQAEEIRAAEKVGADVNKINKKYAKANKELSRAERDAKLALASDFANNIAEIAGKGTAVGKAAAVASATINTYQAATGSYAALSPIPVVGPALGIAAAAAAVVAGLANVKKILSVKSGLPGDSGSGVGSMSASPATVAPPAAIRETVNPEIGAGIVNRTTQQPTDNGVVLQPTLVEDEVTSKQRNANQLQTTSVI